MLARGSHQVAAALFVGAAWLPTLRGSAVTKSDQLETVVPCSLSVLGEAAAVDTSVLERVVRPSGPLSSTEGSETTFYLEKGTPRVVRVVYYGETGQATVTYFLASSKDFVLEREEVEYKEPISIQRQPRISSRVRSTLFVCADKVVDPLGAGGRELAMTELDSAIAWLRAHPK